MKKDFLRAAKLGFNFRQDLELFLTFVEPCIVNVYFKCTNKMHRYTIFFITVNALCFRRFLRPSSGAQNCTRSIWYMSSLLAATAGVSELELTHASGSSKQAWHIPDAACTVLSWAEKPPETCRALIVIKNIVWRCIVLVILERIYIAGIIMVATSFKLLSSVIRPSV